MMTMLMNILCLLLLPFPTSAFVVQPPAFRSSSLHSSLLNEVASGYNHLLDAYPLVTQAVTASVLAGAGDLVAQVQQETTTTSSSNTVSIRLFNEKKQVDLERTGRFMLKGLGGGVIWSFWFALNDQWTNDIMMFDLGSGVNLMTMLGGADVLQSASGDMTVAMDGIQQSTELPVSLTIGRTILSILLEQFVAVPLIYTLWDIPVPTLLSQTQDNGSIPAQVQSKLPALLVDNAKVWTFANLVVYNSPLQYRVLVSSLADIVWQSILSGHVMTNDSEKDDLVVGEPQVLLESILGEAVVEGGRRRTKEELQTGDVLL